MPDASQPLRPPQPPELLESRLEFETLISDTSARLLAAPLERVETAVEHALERVREFFQADRCALLSVGADRQQVHLLLASCAEGIPPVAPGANLARAFTWAARRLLVERLPVRFSSVKEIPSEAAVDRPAREEMGIRSALALPIETEGEVRHLIILQSVREERAWPDVLALRLRALAELMVGALDRKALVAGLREAEARLASGAEIAGLAYYELDYERGVAYVDDRFNDLCGIPPERRQGLQPLEHWLEHLHPEDRPRVQGARQQLHDGRLEKVSLEYRYLHPDRGLTWIHHLAGVARRDASGRAVGTYGVFRDITERKQAEDERSDLSRRLIRAQEDERALLARELHDDVTQRLAVLAIDVGCEELAAADVAQAEKLRAVREGLARLSEDVHALAYQLHPSVLEELGLVEAIRTAGERFGRRGVVALSADLAPVPAGLEKDAALCLFRVTQEALNNVARHARARSVSVTLRQQDGGLQLAVQDDGVGFDPARPEARRRLGLASMRERVRLLNGTFELESAPGRGTAVRAWVPGGAGLP
jgi:PAS domain S-box-containing protein